MKEIEVKDNPLGIRVYAVGEPDIDHMTEEEYDLFASSLALLEDLVRGEWGFCGTMLTDWSSGGSYMNLDQGLATGTDAWLNGANSLVFGHDDKNSKEGVSDMQRAAKNILYTYCNTYYQAQTYGDGMGIKITEDVFPVWIFILIGIDVVAVAGLGTWTYFLFFRRKKKEA